MPPPPPKSVLFSLSGLILWVSEKCPIRYLLLHLRVRALSLSVSRKHHKQDRFRSSVGAKKGRKLRRRICRERPVQHIHTGCGCAGHNGFHLKAQPPTNPPKPCRSGSEATFITCIISPRATKWREWLCRRKEGWGEGILAEPHNGLRAAPQCLTSGFSFSRHCLRGSSFNSGLFETDKHALQSNRSHQCLDEVRVFWALAHVNW